MAPSSSSPFTPSVVSLEMIEQLYGLAQLAQAAYADLLNGLTSGQEGNLLRTER
jgi:hypothetical protein